MDYANLSAHQVIRAILDDNPAAKSPKQIAAFLGLSDISVLKWGEDPDGSGAPICSKYIIPFSVYTRDCRLIEFYAFHIGCRLAELEPGLSINGNIMDEVFNLDILRGALAGTLKTSLSDGRIDAREKRKLSGIAADMIRELRTFQKELAGDE